MSDDNLIQLNPTPILKMNIRSCLSVLFIESELTFNFMVFLPYLPRMALMMSLHPFFSKLDCAASGGVYAGSTFGSNPQAVFTCVLNESGGPGWWSAVLKSSQPLCLKHAGPTTGPTRGPESPSWRLDPSPPETAVSITQLEQIIQTHGGGVVAGIGVSRHYPSEWQSFQNGEFL